jgi:hypothetical protein
VAFWGIAQNSHLFSPSRKSSVYFSPKPVQRENPEMRGIVIDNTRLLTQVKTHTL